MDLSVMDQALPIWMVKIIFTIPIATAISNSQSPIAAISHGILLLASY